MARDIQGPDDVLRNQIDEARVLLADGNWQEARQRLAALAREYPAHAAIYAALGDCYGVAGRWREAVAQYRQCLDREYDPDVAARLAQARQQLTASTESRAVTNRTILAVAASFALMLAVIATVALVTHGNRHAGKGSPSRARIAPAGTVQPPAKAVPPITQTGQAEAPPAPQVGRPSGYTNPTEPPPVTAVPPPPGTPPPPVIITKRVDAPTSDQDYYLTQLLASLNWPSGTSLNGTVMVQTDPYSGFAFVTLSIPRTAQGDLAELATRMAYNVAATLLHHDASLETIEVRALESVGSGAERPRTIVAYRGVTKRETVEYWIRAGTQPSSSEIWNQIFANSWWNPEAPSTASKSSKSK